MRNRRYGKKILSVLLACQMCLSMPVAALAESEDVLLTADVVETESNITAEEQQETELVDSIDEDSEEDILTEPDEVIAEEVNDGGAQIAEDLEEAEQVLEEAEDAEPAAALDEEAQEVSASDFPTEIKTGETYKLTEDITLTSGQQITNLAGTLDGQGHTITLSGTALAENVSGTIQNLGVKGTVDVTKGSVGSMAWTLTGTIQNSYSTVKINDNWNTVGGLVGTITGGTIHNCYYAAELEMMNGGMAATASSDNRSTVSNCYFQSGTGVNTIAMNAANADITNCSDKSADELKTETTVGLLNTGMTATGYIFAVNPDGGFPILVQGTASISWAMLDAALEQAKSYDGAVADTYTEESWKALTDAVAAGQALKENENASQAEINQAAKAITDAIKGLKRQPTTKPVAIPADAIRISSQADFSKMDNAKGKYFVLTQDITIDKNYADDSFYMNYSSFAGVLDGQGHTITFDHAGALFSSLSAGAVVQNLNVTGTMTGNASKVTGPFGERAYGASILNCRSEISGSNVAGFIGTIGPNYGLSAAEDSEGVIANCIAVGDTGKGALCNSNSNNNGAAIIKNCYWVDTLGNGAGAMSEEEMKSLALVDTLNAQKGENGTSWGQGSDGYPYFGENQSYTPGNYVWPEINEGKYQVAFQAYNEQEALVAENGHLEVTPDAVDATKGNIAGTFSLQGYTAPEGSSIEWSFSQRKPERSFAIYDGGLFCVNGTGTAVLTATQVNADETREVLASVAIHSIRKQLTDVKLYIDGEEVTNGKFTVQGSEYKNIVVKAQYSGSDEYQDVSYSSFTYTADEAGQKLLSNRVDSSSGFSFREPGTAVLTVTAKNQPSIARTVTVTSAYVPVKSVAPAISGKQVIHTRNANSDGQETDGRVAFNPILGSAIVTPANATNADKVIITSDDPEGTVAYYTNGEKAYIPKQAGAVTFTATIEDTDPTTGKTNTISGDSTVTFVYRNNVESVELADADKEIAVEAGKNSETFKPIVTGELDDQGYDVTEPALKWTYSKKGIAQVVRTGSGYWKKNGNYNVNDPDYGSYLPVAEYQVMGLSEGTVTATGTPIDNKNHVEPVTITITVTKGTGTGVDVSAKANEGADNALNYIENNHSEKGYAYGNEWLIYAMIQGKKELSEETIDAYYTSVAAEVEKWDASKKPTDIERTALALTRMGKDITDVDGVNLAAMIYNSDKLTNGSNELAYALLALDAANITIPTDAKWSRSAMIAELLKFQNPNGGFGLTDNESASVDMTAMALQALAPYQNRAGVKTAIDQALVYLQKQQRDDFGYGTAESTAQVLLALTCLGIDPTSVEAGFGTPDFNMITNLMKYQQDDGGFSHLTTVNKTNEMATVQVLQALDAYRSGKTTYWAVKGEYVSVMVSILGDEVHNSDTDGTVHVLSRQNLKVWGAQSEYRLAKASTAMEAIDAALAAAGMTCEKKYGDTYIAFVTNKDGARLGEFTNGKNSGWLYSVNGKAAEVGACDYELSDGDEVIFHYTDNYEKENTQEEHQHRWGTGVVTKAATCTAAGVKTYTCECGETETETIPVAGHKYGEWKVTSEATVFAPAVQTRTCSVCGNTETQKTGSAAEAAIKVNATTVLLKVNQKTSALKVTGLANGDSVQSYKSSNTKIFTVSKNGVLKAGKKTGKAALTITLTSGLQKKVTVKVQKKTVATSKITGLQKKVILKKGSKLTLKPSRTPITSTQKFTYKTSNKKIATVNSKGVITAKKAGKAKITVKSGKKKFTVTVTVTK